MRRCGFRTHDHYSTFCDSFLEEAISTAVNTIYLRRERWAAAAAVKIRTRNFAKHKKMLHAVPWFLLLCNYYYYYINIPIRRRVPRIKINIFRAFNDVFECLN